MLTGLETNMIDWRLLISEQKIEKEMQIQLQIIENYIQSRQEFLPALSVLKIP